MGACFGIALTLVVFAGSDLFTGHTMFMTIGLARGTVDGAALARSWILTWVGNLAGAVLLALVFWFGGGGQILKDGADLIFAASAAKMGASATALIARGALCNWLVCLALWTSQRATSDAAKCILIWWCLFAFIAAGFEHSIANMTVFSIALLGNHPASVSLAGAAYNLLWVTIGNVIGGAVFVAGGYLAASPSARAQGPRRSPSRMSLGRDGVVAVAPPGASARVKAVGPLARAPREQPAPAGPSIVMGARGFGGSSPTPEAAAERQLRGGSVRAKSSAIRNATSSTTFHAVYSIDALRSVGPRVSVMMKRINCWSSQL